MAKGNLNLSSDTVGVEKRELRLKTKKSLGVR